MVIYGVVENDRPWGKELAKSCRAVVFFPPSLFHSEIGNAKIDACGEMYYTNKIQLSTMRCRHLLPEYHGELFSVVYDGLVLDEVEVVEMVGEGLQGGEDDGVAEEAGLHGVLGEPVGDQPVLARHRRGAHRAAELPPVLRTLVLGAGLQKIFII